MFASIWLEITIAGFVYVVAIFFAIVAICDVHDLAILRPPNELLPYISAALVGLSYVLGLIFHRLTPLVAPRTFPLLNRLIKRRGKSYTKSPNSYLETAEILHGGSTRVHREVDFQFALVALFRSLVFSIPLLGVTVAIWLLRTHHRGMVLFVSMDVIFWVMSVIAYQQQWRQHDRFKTALLTVVRQTQKLETSK
jgi:hypothetical protein